MQAELNKNELESISKLVIKELIDTISKQATYKKLQEASEERTKEIIDYYLKENVLTWDAKKIIKPILDEHLKETKVIDEKLKEFMNTDYFKSLELKHLKQRVYELETELFKENFDNT